MGYLQKSSADDRYSVSYKLLDLAFHATPAQDVVAAARPFMRQLASEAAQSCHLVVVNGAKGWSFTARRIRAREAFRCGWAPRSI